MIFSLLLENRTTSRVTQAANRNFVALSNFRIIPKVVGALRSVVSMFRTGPLVAPNLVMTKIRQTMPNQLQYRDEIS